MFRKLMEGLFGCSHANYSFPRSKRPVSVPWCSRADGHLCRVPGLRQGVCLRLATDEGSAADQTPSVGGCRAPVLHNQVSRYRGS